MADPQPPNVEARQIVRQETKIRQLEEVGAPAGAIEAAGDILKIMKEKYLEVYGQEYEESSNAAPAAEATEPEAPKAEESSDAAPAAEATEPEAPKAEESGAAPPAADDAPTGVLAQMRGCAT